MANPPAAAWVARLRLMPASLTSRLDSLKGLLAHPAPRYALCFLATVATGIGIFELLDMPLLASAGMPHEASYLRDTRLVRLHIACDLLIGVAYISISFTLAWLVYKASRGLPFNWMLLAFGLFIVAGGFTHFMEVWVMWHPVHWLSGYIKAVTALAAVATAIVVVPLVPRVLRMIADARQSETRRLEVEQLNQELERFNYTVAHDLRAPLRGLTAFNRILVEDHARELSPEARDYLNRMQNSVGRMDALITDLLKYATVGRQELRLEAVALDDILRAVRSIMDGEIASRRAEIVAPSPLPVVLGDAVLLQVVFQNLIANAIKFVGPGVTPRIEITASTEGNGITVSFTDNGIGVPPSARGRIFGIFERLPSREPGTGIGLAITQRAVERLQGSIGVDDASPGPGSRFWVRFQAPPDVPVRSAH